MSCETRIIRGRRVLVVKPRKFGSAARAMAARGWPQFRICAALRMKRERLAMVLAAWSATGRRTPEGAEETPSIWGEFAGVIAEEMRRAG